MAQQLRSGDPEESDFEDWEERLYEGVDPAKAAFELGFTASGFKRRNPERHQKAIAMSREARERVVDDWIERWALQPDGSDTMRQFWAKRWHPGYHRVAVQEATDAPLQIERREVSLTHVVGILRDVGAIEAAPDVPRPGEPVADSRALLPASTNGEAGGVPPPRQ